MVGDGGIDPGFQDPDGLEHLLAQVLPGVHRLGRGRVFGEGPEGGDHRPKLLRVGRQPGRVGGFDNGWRRHVGRDPTPEDFLFPDKNGKPFREDRSDDFQRDLKTAGCSTTYVERNATRHEPSVYSLRHTFATLAQQAGLPSDARDRLLGHAPRDTKARAYEVAELPFLFEQIARIPALLGAMVSGNAAGGGGPEETAGSEVPPTTGLVRTVIPMVTAPGAQSTGSSTISAEEKGFEPSVPVKVRRFSKPLPSTARPLLQIFRTISFSARFCGACQRRPLPIPGQGASPAMTFRLATSLVWAFCTWASLR